jgi:MFS family permease
VAQLRIRLVESGRAFAATARNPSLRRAQLSFGAAWTAEWAFTVAIGVVAFRSGGATAVGIVGFVRLGPAAVLAPLGTALADRFPRDRVLVWSCVVRAAAIAGVAGILTADGSMIVVYAFAAIATAAIMMFHPAHSALLPGLCRTPLELTSANVVRGLVDSVSTLLGSLLAALLLDVARAEAVFTTTAALSLVAGLLLVGLSYERPPRGAPAPLRRLAHETVEGFRALARYRDAGLLIGIGLVQTLTRGFLNVLLVVAAIELLGIGAPGVGLLMAAVGGGAVAGSVGASMLVTGRRLAAVEGAGVALWGLPLTLTGAFPDELAVLALMCVVGIGNALVDIGLYTLPPRLVPEGLLARVFGALESLIALSVALGSIVTPLVIHLLGVRGALVVLGLVAPVTVVLVWRQLRRIDASIAHRDREIELLSSVRIFRPLPMPAIDNLALHVEHSRLAAGQYVFRQGEHGDRFYVIERGEADVIGDGRLLRTIGPGDGFGEIALLKDTLRTATVRARTELELYALERRRFVAAVNSYPSSAHEADALMVERLDPSTLTSRSPQRRACWR